MSRRLSRGTPKVTDSFCPLCPAVQIAVCGKLVIVSLTDCFFNGYSLLCEPVDYSATPQALMIARYCYVYYALKVIDLLDTVSRSGDTT